MRRFLLNTAVFALDALEDVAWQFAALWGLAAFFILQLIGSSFTLSILVAIIIGAVFAILATCAGRLRDRIPLPARCATTITCRHCGYDLTGVRAARCPECGRKTRFRLCVPETDSPP